MTASYRDNRAEYAWMCDAVHLVPTADGDRTRSNLAVVSDLGVDAVKIGMIGSADTAHAVARLALHELTVSDNVFDPVMVASSGATAGGCRTRFRRSNG